MKIKELITDLQRLHECGAEEVVAIRFGRGAGSYTEYEIVSVDRPDYPGAPNEVHMALRRRRD